MNISTRLGSDMAVHLSEAIEIYVSVALLNGHGLDTLNARPATCQMQIAVGIDLPTNPKILRRLLQMNQENEALVSARVYTKIEYFHPKVYLIVKPDRQLIAFLGSANATNGGFDKNIEMNISIADQNVCTRLLLWHRNIYERCRPLDDQFIDEYASVYKKNKKLSSIQRSNNGAFRKKIAEMNDTAIPVTDGQFFTQSDFEAFSTVNHLSQNAGIVDLRRNVKNRFLELNKMIYSRFREYEIDDLHLPKGKGQYVSYFWHTRGYVDRRQDAMWLHYGKSVDQLGVSKDKRFAHNIRMQIILRNNPPEKYIGIWLFVGKPHASIQDRRELKDKLKNEYFLSLFFNYLSELGGSYVIRIGDQKLKISDLDNANQIKQFLKEDNYTDYYVIGRDYDPNDPDLSNENIGETVLIEFAKLFKLYELILNGI